MMQWFKRNGWYAAILVSALILPLYVENRYFMQVLNMSCLFAIGALALNLILGCTGQASLAHGGFFAIGAYGVAVMTTSLQWSFWVALPLAALLAAVVGLLVGALALRTRGAYFAIVTLCLGEIIHLVAGNWLAVTGGHNGIMGIPPPDVIPVPFLGAIGFSTLSAQYYLVLSMLLLTLLTMHRLVKSLKGLAFMSIRSNEVLAESLGINSFRTKMTAFAIADFFVALAGGLYASLIGSITPSVASLKITFDFLLFVLLGGVATLAGPVIGAFTIPVLAEWIQFLQDYQMMIYGFLLIIVTIYFPMGLMGGIARIRQKLEKN
ncbi:branched-chain amino acid ABC transporter permease [Desulfatitalea alkaliphila]|uniref:Branched-chain amino acid ABC transporter permease n=1 Tax=Desulfatitalea alkaliphila TaxID=2929485 RepID=A0AA41QZC2_9BACT|nr:branched-chain amino acid ABC transporter permease [Desulfatitalea alkaliphila]MCJ8499222.1 branched-chain amino acid ABC transporter permease [Desulfatitalea alkaliphila]